MLDSYYISNMKNMIGDLTVIEESKLIEGTYYEMCFWYADHKGTWGFSFECDKKGNLLPFKNEDAEANYHKCLTGDVNGHKVLPGVIRDTDYSYYTKTVAKCHCGSKIVLANFTNTCDCGRDYNSSGQELAPREQWGEETGEHWSDCY